MHEPLLDSFIADVKHSPEGRVRGWPFPNNDNYVWVHPNVAPSVAARIREHCSACIAQAALQRTCNSTQTTHNQPSTGGSAHSQVTRNGDAKHGNGGIVNILRLDLPRNTVAATQIESSRNYRRSDWTDTYESRVCRVEHKDEPDPPNREWLCFLRRQF